MMTAARLTYAGIDNETLQQMARRGQIDLADQCTSCEDAPGMRYDGHGGSSHCWDCRGTCLNKDARRRQMRAEQQGRAERSSRPASFECPDKRGLLLRIDFALERLAARLRRN